MPQKKRRKWKKGQEDKREKNIERAWKQGKQKRKKRVCQTKNSVRAKGRRNNKNFRHIKYDILARRQPGRKISYIEAWLAGWLARNIVSVIWGHTPHSSHGNLCIWNRAWQKLP